VSRFAVSKEFRRRRGEYRYPDVSNPNGKTLAAEDRRVFPYITFGLLAACSKSVGSRNRSHLCGDGARLDPAARRIG